MKMTLIVVFGVISLLIFGMGAYEFYMQFRLLQGVKSVKATVTGSDVVMKDDPTSDESVRTYYFTPRVTFVYEFDGVRHESSMMRPVESPIRYLTKDQAAVELKAYPVGATVDAFVSGNYPEKAYLIKEYSSGPIWFMVIGVGIMVVIFALIKILKL